MRSTLALHSGHDAAQHNQHLAVFTTLKKALRMDWEGGKLRFLLGPPPGFRYCSDMLLCGLLGTKEGGWGGEGGGSLATQWPYHASPPSFTVIMNQDLSGWAEVHASHLTSHKLATQEVNVKLMRGKGGRGLVVLVNLNQITYFKTWLGLIVRHHPLHLLHCAQPYPYKVSLNRPSAPPLVRKVMHLKTR